MLSGIAGRQLRLQWGMLRAAARGIHWPACPDPSPYQIFGLDAGASVIDKKQLRQAYFDLVKVYHPDRGTTGDAERFKRIVEAHDILKDDMRRRTYDASRVYDSTKTSGVRYQRTYRSHFDDDSDINYWSHANKQKFDQGLYENRIWVLKCVIAVTAIIAGANLLLLKQAAETRAELLDVQTEKAAAQLARVASSRYPDDTPQDVIERFLANRQRTLDRYGQQISYKAICDGPQAEASASKPAAPHVAAAEQNEASGARPRPARAQRESKPWDEEGPPRPLRRANGEHEGPVAAYFGR